MLLMVKVIPNAPKNQVVGMHQGVYKIRIKSPPDKGKANEELIEFLAEILKVPKKHIHLISGHSSRLKKIKIEGEVDLLTLL